MATSAPPLITDTNAVAGQPTWTERLTGSTAAASGTVCAATGTAPSVTAPSETGLLGPQDGGQVLVTDQRVAGVVPEVVQGGKPVGRTTLPQDTPVAVSEHFKSSASSRCMRGT